MRLLIIGDLDGQISAASNIAISRGAKVGQVSDIDAALEALRSGSGADLIMIDVKKNIGELISRLNAERIFVPVVGCGLEKDKSLAVKAIKDGAKEYISLPPDEELIVAILQAITDDSKSIISNSPKMREVISIAEQVASSDANILITGQSGTGKEIMSRFIYQKSRRAGKSFISVNCAAIPDNLLESELFGHEKGAFTGAIARRIGKFEESNNGTLLLDEISEIDIKLQAKLLRAIQEQEIDRIGGSKPIKLNLRIIATSNRDLKQEVLEGKFREDLYYRLNVININLPNLQDRPEDIMLFAEHFIKKYCISNSMSVKILSPESIEILHKHNWPGNVRELENTIYRAVLLSKSEIITPESLMINVNINKNEGMNNNFIGRTMHSVEKDLILSTLKYCLGDSTNTANILGISLKALRNKLEEYENESLGLE